MSTKGRPIRRTEKRRSKLYAFHLRPNGAVDYIGEVVSETADSIRLEAIDAIMSVGSGLWCLSGALYDLPKSECRLFNDRDACHITASQINDRMCPRFRRD